MSYKPYSEKYHASLFKTEAPFVVENKQENDYFYVDDEESTLVGYRVYGHYAEVSLNRSEQSKKIGFSPKFWNKFYSVPVKILGVTQLIAEAENPKINILLRRQKWYEYAPNHWVINLDEKIKNG
jgi:hypothetical protein